MCNRVLNTPKIALPVGAGVDEDSSPLDVELLSRALEKIIYLRFAGREVDFTKYTEIVCDTMTFNNGKPHRLRDLCDRHRHRLFQSLWTILLKESGSLIFQILFI